MQTHLELPAKFAALGIEAPFLRALRKIGFTEPTDIQRELIPRALTGRDILGQARTGTGKTAAFGLPALQMVDPAGRLQVLCLSPTRELAVQVCGEMRRLAAETELHIVPVYGGQKVQTQIHLLGKRTQAVVGTPGRILDLMGRGVLRTDHITVAILDEVDRMLDIGFRDDIKRILQRIQQPHQTLFVSATLDDEIVRLARQFMRDPIEVNVSRDEITVDDVEQFYCSVEPYDKYRMLRATLDEEDPKLIIIFCNTKHGARKLAKKLHADGIDAKDIHGDLVQRKRERVMERFRRHQLRVLIATDLASRGLDISAITHIINYDIPLDPQVYVHRIGRTARMGARGRAITFVTPEEGKQITEIEKLINKLLQPISFSTFKPRVPDRVREDRPTGDLQPQASEVSQSDATAPSTPRTLGGKFRTRRGRRL